MSFCIRNFMNEVVFFNILAQFFGFLGTYMLFTLYQQQDRIKLLKRKLYADVLWALHYIFLLAWAGAIPNLIGIIREAIFMHNDKKWAKSLIWPVIFIGFSWSLVILTWQSTLSLLPMCASTLVTISLWVKSPKLTKCLSIPVCAAFIIYDVCIGSYAGIVNESISLISITISFVKNVSMKKRL